MLKNNKIKIIALLLVLMLGSVITRAIQKLYFAPPPKPVVKPLAMARRVEPVYDKALLAKFQSLCKKYDTVKLNYTLTGMISMENKADTAGKMTGVNFICCRKNGAFYYKLGVTETINANGLYLYIDHQAKTVVLSEQKTVTVDQGPMASMVNMGSSLKGEGYQLLSSVKGGTQTITLLNEHHISCKQYSISFDTLNMQVNHMYARLTNIEYPLRRDKEQVMDINITRWDDTADLEKYVTKNAVVKSQNGEWKLVERFSNYELIKM